MAKMDWDRVNIENLDYRHKNETERKEEEKALFAYSLPETGSHILYPCPYCELNFSASRYRFHFVEAHFLRTGSVSIVILLAKIGSDVLLFSAIPTCIFDDVWKFLRANFDLNRDYSPREIMNNLPIEAQRLMVEARAIRLSGRQGSDVQKIAQVLQVVAERIGWIVRWKYIPLNFRVVRFDKSFMLALLEELRRRSGMAKGNTKRKKPKKKRKSSQPKSR